MSTDAAGGTALDPSYAGAHAEISQSAAAALRRFFGDDRLDFSLTNPSLPGVERSFQSFLAGRRRGGGEPDLRRPALPL